MTTATTGNGTRTTETAGRESELRAAARWRGLTMKDLAALIGVSEGYLSQVANGHRPWTPKMREKVMAVLGEVPGQGTVYRQGAVAVSSESSFIRERARTLGMTMQDLADEAGVSYSYLTQAARGRQHMGVKVQARVESALKAPAKVAPARWRQPPGERGDRGEQLHQGARPRPGHDHAGAGRAGRRLLRLPVGDIPGP